ncbi:phospholipid phosphatase 1-like [Haliotis rubra]|uniref:phospholipid phosphatase 1-like n=1 Tax=Haliotis rubra TaxID=36100 RepID=UPI001EE59328|nr:phospholipid phosphatase 1-like [Haliotis rubra]
MDIFISLYNHFRQSYGLPTDLVTIGAMFVEAIAIFKVDVTPFGRGFFCNDQSLMYPYHDDTVTMVDAALIGVLPQVLLLASVAKRTFFNMYGKLLFAQLGVACFGGGICYLTTEVVKLVVGRLRPHFFDVCKPDFSKINCSTGYIVDYVCQGTNDALIIDAKKSFPSGHSSFIAFAMTYIIMYVQLRLGRKNCRLLRALLQFGAALGGVYVCVSRISDYKHHWSDVLGGAVLGILTSALTVLYVNDVKRINMVEETSDEKSPVPLTKFEKTEPAQYEDVRSSRRTVV